MICSLIAVFIVHLFIYIHSLSFEQSMDANLGSFVHILISLIVHSYFLSTIYILNIDFFIIAYWSVIHLFVHPLNCFSFLFVFIAYLPLVYFFIYFIYLFIHSSIHSSLFALIHSLSTIFSAHDNAYTGNLSTGLL